MHRLKKEQWTQHSPSGLFSLGLSMCLTRSLSLKHWAFIFWATCGLICCPPSLAGYSAALLNPSNNMWTWFEQWFDPQSQSNPIIFSFMFGMTLEKNTFFTWTVNLRLWWKTKDLNDDDLIMMMLTIKFSLFSWGCLQSLSIVSTALRKLKKVSFLKPQHIWKIVGFFFFFLFPSLFFQKKG